MARTNVTQQATTEALDMLRTHFPAGSTIYTILRNVSRSGMSRVISVVAMTPDGPRFLSYQAAQVLGMSCTNKGEAGVKVGGCGMDMGFHLAYNLSHLLHGDGYACSHRWL
jgi:hypothetical protein